MFLQALELQPNNNEAKSCLKDLREKKFLIERPPKSLITDESTSKVNKDDKNQEENSRRQESVHLKDNRDDSVSIVKDENSSDDEYFCGPERCLPEGCSNSVSCK